MWEKVNGFTALIGVNAYDEHILLKIIEGDEENEHLDYGFDGCFLRDSPVSNIPKYKAGTVYEAKLEYWLETLYELGQNDFEYKIVDTKVKEIK